MLEYAKEKAEARGIANISFLHAGLLTFDLGVASCDHVVSTAALPHLPDFWKMVALRRIHRALKDGGRLYVGDLAFSFEIDEYRQVLGNGVREAASRVDDDFAKDAATTYREEFPTFAWILAGMITRAGFHADDIQVRLNTWINYVCTKSPQQPNSSRSFDTTR